MTFAALALSACLGPTEAPRDPGIGAVAAPASPELGACPGSSVVAHEHGPSTCEPWAFGDRPRCGGAEMPSASGCRSVGRACDAVRAPDPDGRIVLHVDASAPAGGDGSPSAPFTRIADALVARSNDVTIRLAEGEHDGNVVLGDGVTLEGVCAERTTVAHRAIDGDPDTIVQVDGVRVVLRDLRIHGAAGFGVRAVADAELTMEGVVVEGAELAGIACGRCELDARDVLVRDSVGRDGGSPATGGYGFFLQSATVSLSGVTVERVNEVGVAVAAGTEALLRELVVLDVAMGPAGLMGVGLVVSGESHVDARSLVVEGAARAGVVVEDASHATLTDVLVREVTGLRASEHPEGWALDVGGAEVEVRRFVAAHTVGGIELVGGSALLEDVRLDDIYGADEVFGAEHDMPVGGWGVALRAVGGAHIVASRIHAERIADLAIFAHEASEVDLGDVRVLGVAGAFDPALGIDQVTGMALLARGGAHVALHRAELANATLLAVAAAESDATTLSLEDVIVRDVAPGPFASRAGGRALIATQGASIVGARVRVERASELALSAWMGGRLELQDFVVSDTLTRADGTAGIAVAAYGGGHLALERFVISGAPLCGLQLAHGASLPTPDAPLSSSGGTATLHAGRIERAPIGVNVQVAGTDLEALVAELTFSEVDRRLAADSLPVPMPDVSQVLDP